MRPYTLSWGSLCPPKAAVTAYLSIFRFSGPVGFRVSDAGFTYRELEAIGAERSFPRVAKAAAERESVAKNRRVIFVDVSAEDLTRAICDVAAAS